MQIRHVPLRYVLERSAGSSAMQFMLCPLHRISVSKPVVYSFTHGHAQVESPRVTSPRMRSILIPCAPLIAHGARNLPADTEERPPLKSGTSTATVSQSALQSADQL